MGSCQSNNKKKKNTGNSNRENSSSAAQSNLVVNGHRPRQFLANRVDQGSNNQRSTVEASRHNINNYGTEINEQLRIPQTLNQNQANDNGINQHGVLPGNSNNPQLNPTITFQLSENENNVNVSINEEFPSRRNLPTGRYYTGRVSIGRPISSENINVEGLFFCSRCSNSFPGQREYEQHLTYCDTFRNSRQVNSSLNDFLHLVHSLNRHLQGHLLELEECEEANEYIDWTSYKVEGGSQTIWKTLGKVTLSPEELQAIEKIPIEGIKNEKYFKKRIWFLKYINENIYDKSAINSPLVIARENILEHSYNQFVTTKELNLKQAMQIYFIDEAAYDGGGVYREWYTTLFKAIFSKEENFFEENKAKSLGKNSFFIPTTLPKYHMDDYLSYYEFIGNVIAKALLDKIMINGNFNHVLIKQLLKLPLTVEDLKFLDIEIYSSLMSILSQKIIEEDPSLTLTWNLRKGNIVEEVELIPNGRNIILGERNKQLFANKVVELICTIAVKDKLNALIRGFNSLIPHEIISIFNADEFDFLLSGQNEIDLSDWKANTVYKGYYSETHPTVKMFWEILEELKPEELLSFFTFCTGCTRVPLDGFQSLYGTRQKVHKFCIESPAMKEKTDNNRLIEAKTCFNRIHLPEYSTKEKMKKAIITIINNDTNFFGLQ